MENLKQLIAVSTLMRYCMNFSCFSTFNFHICDDNRSVFSNMSGIAIRQWSFLYCDANISSVAIMEFSSLVLFDYCDSQGSLSTLIATNLSQIIQSWTIIESLQICFTFLKFSASTNWPNFLSVFSFSYTITTCWGVPNKNVGNKGFFDIYTRSDILIWSSQEKLESQEQTVPLKLQLNK